MDRSFEILINPDLIINLTDPGYYKRRRSLSGQVRKPKPAPIQDQQERRQRQEEPWHHPSPPPAVPASVHPRREVIIKEVEPLRRTVAECERVLDTLRTQDSTAHEEAQRRAKELHERQHKVNRPKPFPCLEARQACLRCYQENPMDSLKCADTVRAYAECAQQVRQRFATTGFS